MSSRILFILKNIITIVCVILLSKTIKNQILSEYHFTYIILPLAITIYVLLYLLVAAQHVSISSAHQPSCSIHCPDRHYPPELVSRLS